jgi:hypothetical protein
MSISNQSVGTVIKVYGTEKVNRAFLQAGADAQDIKKVMEEAGKVVEKSANPPILSGQLAASVRSGAGKTKAIISAGGDRTPYGPVIHYGWGARGITPNPFLMNALQRQSKNVYNIIDNGIEDILKKSNLK